MSILNFSCPHITPKPGTEGKIVFLTGPPGAGKSSTCQLMAREKGFIYFEGDCVMQFINPFTDPHVDNPSIASAAQPPLKVLHEVYQILFVISLHVSFRA